MRSAGYTVLAGAAVTSLLFVRILEPTTLAITAFLSGWLLLPYAVLALILALSAQERSTAMTCVLTAMLVAAGGLLFLTGVIFVYPDPQGGIAVLFTPIYQALSIAVLLPLTRWLVKKLSRPG
jgi:hypothetical protein